MYNGNNYGGRDNRGGYPNQNRQANQRLPYQQAPVEIKPETVPEDYVDRAEAVIKEIKDLRPTITTSKIRNLLSLISDIYNVEKLNTGANISAASAAKIGMMRVRTAYEAGRDNATKTFVEKARLLQYLKGIGTDREKLIRFAHYMEALVAYHKFYGGKEN